MLEVSPTNIRMFSMLGQRGTFGYILTELAEGNERIVALTGDLCNTSGLDRFQEAYPDRLVNVGIAEQNMLGVAAGLADSGLLPFATTFANFATMRACEWVRHFMGYMECNIILVGFGAGFAMELFGNTHYGIEDIASIRAIPNIRIFSPADCLEVVKCVTAAVENPSPTYMRLTGKMGNPVVHRKDFDFVEGNMISLQEGSDVIIFASGSMVRRSWDTCNILKGLGVSCSLYDVHTIKPLDRNLLQYIGNKKLIVTVEEHGIIGGLGSAIADEISKYVGMPPLMKLGVSQGYKKAGEYEYMLEENRLTPELLAEDIVNTLEGKNND